VASPRKEDGRSRLGRLAEGLAAEALERAGLEIVARNWRRPEGELDLVARASDGTCVFCEVRSRTGEATGDPLESIDGRKRARVVRAARLYLNEEPVNATAFRFDVVGVTFFPDGSPPRVVHVPAAFEASD
jgi:putative endonuclease